MTRFILLTVSFYCQSHGVPRPWIFNLDETTYTQDPSDLLPRMEKSKNLIRREDKGHAMASAPDPEHILAKFGRESNPCNFGLLGLVALRITLAWFQPVGRGVDACFLASWHLLHASWHAMHCPSHSISRDDTIDKTRRPRIGSFFSLSFLCRKH